MSLISSANFIAPFRSKFQIVGVLVIAFLVAVVRMASSGTISNESGVRGQVTQDAARGERVKDPDVEAYLASKTRGRVRSASGGDVTVDNLLKGGETEANVEPSDDADDAEAVREPGKLNDIKRSLGME